MFSGIRPPGACLSKVILPLTAGRVNACGADQIQPLGGLLAHFVFLHLSGGIHGEGLDKLNVFGHLMPRV